MSVLPHSYSIMRLVLRVSRTQCAFLSTPCAFSSQWNISRFRQQPARLKITLYESFSLLWVLWEKLNNSCSLRGSLSRPRYVFLAYFLLFERIKVCLRDYHAGYSFVRPPHQLPNALTTVYETVRMSWYLDPSRRRGFCMPPITLCECMCTFSFVVQNKRTPRPLVRERTIPTERQPIVDEI
jgi:hypothetical protein